MLHAIAIAGADTSHQYRRRAWDAGHADGRSIPVIPVDPIDTAVGGDAHHGHRTFTILTSFSYRRRRQPKRWTIDGGRE